MGMCCEHWEGFYTPPCHVYVMLGTTHCGPRLSQQQGWGRRGGREAATWPGGREGAVAVGPVEQPVHSSPPQPTPAHCTALLLNALATATPPPPSTPYAVSAPLQMHQCTRLDDDERLDALLEQLERRAPGAAVQRKTPGNTLSAAAAARTRPTTHVSVGAAGRPAAAGQQPRSSPAVRPPGGTTLRTQQRTRDQGWWPGSGGGRGTRGPSGGSSAMRKADAPRRCTHRVPVLSPPSATAVSYTPLTLPANKKVVSSGCPAVLHINKHMSTQTTSRQHIH